MDGETGTHTAPPEAVEVMRFLPDYPPKYLRIKVNDTSSKKADGPERIEREWWLDKGSTGIICSRGRGRRPLLAVPLRAL